jgi:hypothetical protein
MMSKATPDIVGGFAINPLNAFISCPAPGLQLDAACACCAVTALVEVRQRLLEVSRYRQPGNDSACGHGHVGQRQLEQFRGGACAGYLGVTKYYSAA